MKAKSTTVYICQLTNSFLKVVKCVKGRKTEFLRFEAESLSPNTSVASLTDRVKFLFKKIGYRQEPIILSIPHNSVTCRYLKVPTQVPQEIERIAVLQAARYLPYPEQELITGYQVISIDEEGYSYLNLVIVHKDVIERILETFKNLNAKSLTIVLSSYGLTFLLNSLMPDEQESVLMIDIDSEQAELAIVAQQKLLYSRHFKLAASAPDWKDSFLVEISKTERAYLEEVARGTFSKIVITGREDFSSELTNAFNQQKRGIAQVLPYTKILGPAEQLFKNNVASNISFANLIGLGLGSGEESLNLMPQILKEKIQRAAGAKHAVWLGVNILIIIAMLVIGATKNLDSKALYLNTLKAELGQISKEAKPLEELEKRYKVLQGRFQDRDSVLELIYELHRIVNSPLSLANIIYEEGEDLILHGQTPELNSVFEFVGVLKKSPAFKAFNIKVKYAASKRTSAGDIVDFEIIGVRKK